MASSPYNGKTSKSVNPMLRLSESSGDRYILNKSSHPNELSRYHGGHRRDNHPYISGYWYFIINPPAKLFGTEGSNTLQEARDWMFTTAESFTPPSRNLTKVDIPGMGGMASSYISGQDITRTFSVTFREYQELPIFNILQTWTSVMDPNTGTSVLAGDEFIPANYKGSAFAALCKPTVGNRAGSDNSILAKEDIEQVFYFDGVFPDSAPWDSLASDISTNDGLSIAVNFNFDGFPLLKDSDGVVTEFLKLVNSEKISRSYSHYIDSVSEATSADSRTSGKLLKGDGNLSTV